jgi:hypothetical protein
MGHTRRRPARGTPNAKYREHVLGVSTEAPVSATRFADLFQQVLEEVRGDLSD